MASEDRGARRSRWADSKTPGRRESSGRFDGALLRTRLRRTIFLAEKLVEVAGIEIGSRLFVTTCHSIPCFVLQPEVFGLKLADDGRSLQRVVSYLTGIGQELACVKSLV